MTSLCLIRLPQDYLVHPDAQIPLGLLYVAASARESGYPTQVYRWPSRRAGGAARPPAAHVYGITATTLDYALDGERVAAEIRAAQPDAKIILGGPVCLDPGQVNYRFFDTLVIGDGERAIKDIMAAVKAGEALPPVMRGAHVDISQQPWPARDLWPGSLGGPVFAGGKEYFGSGSTVIAGARGCPFECAFCANPAVSDRRVRQRSIQDIVHEMEHVVLRHNVHQFRFSDETFNITRQRVAAFCQAIQENDLLRGNIAWRASVRSTPNDRDMYAEMYDAGCRELSIGIESADPMVLAAVKKGETIGDGLCALEHMRQVGITSRALLMTGLPGESPVTVERNLRFLLNAPYDICSMTVFVPFPGCEIWEHPERFGCEIVNRDYSQYNLYFFDAGGARTVRPYVKLAEWDYEEHANAVDLMRRAAQALGKLNRG